MLFYVKMLRNFCRKNTTLLEAKMKNLVKKPTIIQHHNNFNKLNLSELTAVQHDILMRMILAFKDKGDEILEFSVADMQKMIKGHRKINEIQEISYDLFQKLFKIDYDPIMTATHSDKIELINLFDHIQIQLNQKMPTKMPMTQKIPHIKAFKLRFSRTFQYLINKNFENYTSTELNEFISLQNVTSKTLYKLLKQSQHFGSFQIDWLEFCRICGFLNENNILKLRIDNIMREVNKAVNEIQNLRSVFGDESFKDLKMTKIYKGLGTGKGGKTIDSLFFEFKARKRRNKTLANTLYNIKNEVESLAGYEVKTHIIPKKIIVNNTPKN